MPAKTILKMGNPMLYQIAEPVDDPTSHEIAELISDMRASLDAVQGNGLAAPQIGVNLRVVVYRMPERIIPDGSCQSAIPWTTMINPTIKKTSTDKKHIWERCLSIPGLYGKVPRYTEVECSYTNLNGEKVQNNARGFHAMTLQHECDHLEGILYPMRMDDLASLRFVSEIDATDGFYRYSADEFD